MTDTGKEDQGDITDISKRRGRRADRSTIVGCYYFSTRKPFSPWLTTTFHKAWISVGNLSEEHGSVILIV